MSLSLPPSSFPPSLPTLLGEQVDQSKEGGAHEDVARPVACSGQRVARAAEAVAVDFRINAPRHGACWRSVCIVVHRVSV